MRASWSSFSMLRALLLVAGVVLLVPPAFCGYTARLWFENITRGTSNAGALLCYPGDQIAIRYRFFADDQTGNTEKWGTLQATLILDGITIISDAQANTWATQVNSVLTPPTHFPIKTFWQPDYGPMYDGAVDPSDSTYPKIADKALYALVGVGGNREASWNFSRTLFTFTIAAGSEGQEMHWAFPNRLTGTGVSTRILDYQGISVLVTDNWISVASSGSGEPTTTLVEAIPNPAIIGDLVLLTATVTPVPDGGTVQFAEDGVAVGDPRPVVNGRATLTKSYSSTGSRRIRATYSGTAQFASSSGETVLQVNRIPTETMVTAQPNPVHRNNPVLLQAVVSPAPNGGQVEFAVEGQYVGGSAVVNGLASITIYSHDLPGNYLVSATFQGTSTYAPSTGSTPLVVLKTETTTMLYASPNPSRLGETVYVWTELSPWPDGGLMEIRLDGQLVYSGSPNGYYYAYGLPFGSHTLRAEYSGTLRYAASSATRTIHVVPFGSWVSDSTTGKLYLLPNSTGSWPDMQRLAATLGGDLVTVSDADEKEWLYATYGDGIDYWLGLRDVKPPGSKWRWESGEETAYTWWADGQPGSGEVAVMARDRRGKWESRPINHVAYGIIERTPADLEVLEVPSEGTATLTRPLAAGRRYFIEASGQWGGKHQGRRADAEFYRDSFGQWHETAPGDGLDLLLNGTKVDWMGTTDGFSYHPHTYSPSHVYRYEVLGDGQPLALAIDNGGSVAPLGSLQVRVYAVERVGAYQGDAPWPTLHADSASTHNSPWAIAPQYSWHRWSVYGIGEPLAINAKGDIYCGWGSRLQRVSASGQQLGSIQLSGEWLTAVAIGVNGTVYALTDTSLTALHENLAVMWSVPQGGHGNLVLDCHGVLYHTGVSGDNRVHSVGRNGVPRWTVTLDVPVNGTGLSVGADDKLYVSTEVGTGQCRVYRLTLDGEVEGFVIVPGYYASAPVLSPEGRMYVTTTKGLYAFGPNGEPLWNYSIPAWANGKPTLLANGRIGVVGGWSPGVRVNMYQFDPDGTLLWKLPETIQYVWAAGTDALGGMWNVGWNQDLWLSDFLGAEAWSRSFGPVFSMGGPIIGADGTLYQHVNDTLYAIGPGQRVKQETMLLVDDAYTDQGGSVTLQARLALGRTGGGISGRTVSFRVDGVPVGQVQTDSLGYASLDYSVGAVQIGRHEITASWVGDSQYWDNGASAALWVDVPASAIQGQVFLELWQRSTTDMPVTYQVLDGNGSVVSEGWTTLGAQGAYRIEVQHNGLASLRIKGSHWLSHKVDGLVLDPSAPAYASFLLKNGDVDGNNQVGLPDMNEIMLRFNSTLPSEADLNGSGKVDLEDLTIVLINFHKVGT